MPICFFSFFSCTCTYDREAIDNLTQPKQRPEAPCREILWFGGEKKKNYVRENLPHWEGNLPCWREILPSLQGIKHFSRLGHGHPSQKTNQQLVMIECIFKSSRVNVGIIVTLFCHVTDVSLYSPEEGTSQWNCFLLWTWWANLMGMCLCIHVFMAVMCLFIYA